MEPAAAFGHQLRTRTCGLLVKSREILLVQIYSPARESLIWVPPGGALKTGETLKEAAEREFCEETNLQVTAGNLLHINEFMEPPFYAIEFFFEASNPKGELTLGTDPELSEEDQLLRDLQWFNIEDLPTNTFSPQSLLPVIGNWDNRQSVPISRA